MNSYSMFACMGAIFLRSGFAHVDNVITKRCSKQSHGCFCQGCKATNPTGTLRNLPKPSGTNFPEPSGTCLRNLHQHTPRNLPELPPGTYTRTHRNSPEPTSGTCASTDRNLPEPNSPEPSGTCLRNLHQHAPELSGTFQNLPPEPTPAHTGTLRHLPGHTPWNLHQHAGTLRNLPEPSSGTCSCDPHRSFSGLKTPVAYAVGEK